MKFRDLRIYLAGPSVPIFCVPICILGGTTSNDIIFPNLSWSPLFHEYAFWEACSSCVVHLFFLQMWSNQVSLDWESSTDNFYKNNSKDLLILNLILPPIFNIFLISKATNQLVQLILSSPDFTAIRVVRNR